MNDVQTTSLQGLSARCWAVSGMVEWGYWE